MQIALIYIFLDIQIKFHTRQMVCLGRRVFVASHRLFLKRGRPKMEQFSISDGLHPIGFGTDILEGFFATGYVATVQFATII